MKMIFLSLLAVSVCFISITGCNSKKPQFITTLTISDSAATQAQIDTAITVLKKRLIRHGLTDASVSSEEKQIKIQSAQLNKEWITDYLLKKGILTFYECYSITDVAASLQEADKTISEKEHQTYDQGTGGPLFNAFYSLAGSSSSYNGTPYVPAYIGMVLKDKIPLVKKYIAMASAVLPADAELLFVKENDDVKKKQLYAAYFIRNNGRQLTLGNHIVNASANFENKRAVIKMQFDAYSAHLWQRMTTANVNKYIAIVIDGVLLSAPNVIGPIEGGNTEISGAFSKEESNEYANLLNSGYLPINLVLKNTAPLKKE